MAHGGDRAGGSADPLAGLAALPGVADAVDRARDACTSLRWHSALRRRSAEARAESGVRAARASAALEGAELPLEQVRELVTTERVSSPPPDWDPVSGQVLGALRATLAADGLGAVLSTAPAQALARLHLAALSGMADVDPELLGRPRPAGTLARDLVDLGPAPEGVDLTHRLGQLVQLLTRPTQASVLVVSAVVHGELLALRPFVAGNGVVARAAARALVVSRGLDPTGVAVPEVGLLASGGPAYLGAAMAYASGEPDGVAAWISHWAAAVEVGAREGELVAETVAT